MVSEVEVIEYIGEEGRRCCNAFHQTLRACNIICEEKRLGKPTNR